MENIVTTMTVPRNVEKLVASMSYKIYTYVQGLDSDNSCIGGASATIAASTKVMSYITLLRTKHNLGERVQT